MLRTLYSRIAAVLFVLLCLMGYIVYHMVLYSSEMYQQELTQKLNVELAKHIVDEEPLFMESDVTFPYINQNALESLFHWLMVVNPSIEIYLLDTSGEILAFNSPEGHVKRQRVDMAPVLAYLDGNNQFPLLGDDPRDTSGSKVFSAAPIQGKHPNGDPVAGYLYVILEGEAYDSVTDLVKGSYILQFTTTGLGASLLIALVIGLIAFGLLTRRLRLLSQMMASYGKAGNEQQKRFPVSHTSNDEIDVLGTNFNQMADRIDEQVDALKNNDAKRREMVANVSHDLRTPLTSLHGYLETLLLKEDKLSSDERRQYLEIATAHSSQLIQLVSELFELAKLDSSETLLNVEPFSLAELIQDVAHKFSLEARDHHIDLKVDTGKNLPFAYGDIGLIQRVLGNLIENALRYTPAGGRITLSLRGDTNNIVVKVADTGQGIPSEEIPHIFDRFYRLEKNRTGSGQNAGLGLAIVKRIIDLHGSNIQADSRPNTGTTFSFALPVYPMS